MDTGDDVPLGREDRSGLVTEEERLVREREQEGGEARGRWDKR